MGTRLTAESNKTACFFFTSLRSRESIGIEMKGFDYAIGLPTMPGARDILERNDQLMANHGGCSGIYDNDTKATTFLRLEIWDLRTDLAVRDFCSDFLGERFCSGFF